RRLLEELNDTIADFVDQNDALTLVVAADDTSMAVIVKTLEGLDEQNGADVFLVFPDDAGPPDAYVASLVARLEAQRTQINELLSEEGKPPWPELPPSCHDPRLPPAERLHAAIGYVRARMPEEGDHRLVVALLPIAIRDPAGYAQIVASLVPRGPIQPWMRGTRMLVRDDRGAPFLIPALRNAEAPGVLVYEPDFSPSALEAALGEEALDPETPVAARMQALMQLAALDYAHQRFGAAIEKYSILFAYYEGGNAKEMQALCLQGIGDVLRRAGRPAEAKQRYQQGLAYSAESPAAVITLNLCVSAGDVCLELGQIDEADGYFGIADKLASKLLNPSTKADCMEKQGIIQETKGNRRGALELYRDAAQMCREFEYPERLASVLERLRILYRGAGLLVELGAVEQELAGLRASGHGVSS
ncbi:MAG TPA: hypothetical protein VKY73_09700, partial [Polyangiaceae bacterium]|nr:hypothetical protein [Polyangiaceae bacterium]